MKFDLSRGSKVGGISLIFLVGMIHLITAQEHLKAAPWIGWAFLVLVLGTLLAVVGIDQGMQWRWSLGVLLAGGAFIAFIVSRTLGLPWFRRSYRQVGADGDLLPVRRGPLRSPCPTRTTRS